MFLILELNASLNSILYEIGFPKQTLLIHLFNLQCNAATCQHVVHNSIKSFALLIK